MAGLQFALSQVQEKVICSPVYATWGKRAIAQNTEGGHFLPVTVFWVQGAGVEFHIVNPQELGHSKVAYQLHDWRSIIEVAAPSTTHGAHEGLNRQKSSLPATVHVKSPWSLSAIQRTDT